MLPILVASKGRPDGRFLRLLEDGRLPYTLFLEAQDVDAYAAAGRRPDEVVVLDQADQGLPYVRQAILDHARARGIGWYWMPDDDLTKIVEIVAAKTVPVPIGEALSTAEGYFLDVPRIGQASIDHAQFAWRAKQPIVYGSYCDGFVAIRSDVLADYRPAAGTKVDRDYTLQVLASGSTTARVTRYGFVTPSMTTVKGGCHAWYERGDEARDAEALAELWGPSIVRVVDKPNGRRDARIAWRRFRQPRQETVI
jgi:hypothetical protein